MGMLTWLASSLIVGYERGAHAKATESHAEKQDERLGLAGHFAAQRNWSPGFRAGCDDRLKYAQNGGSERLAKVADFWIVAVGSHQILN